MDINLADFQNQVENYQTQTEAGTDIHERLKLTANSMFKKTIRVLIYAAAFLLPLWFLPFAADGLAFDKQVLLIAISGAGLILYLWDIIKNGVFRYRRSPFYWPMAGVILAGIVSVIFSVNRFSSVFGMDAKRGLDLIGLVSFAVLFFLAISTIEDRGKTLKATLTLSLALAFLFGLLQMLGIFIFKGAFATNGFNTVGAIDALGILAAISLPLLLSSNRGDSGFAEYGQPEQTRTSIFQFKKLADYSRYPGFVFALFLLVLINWWPVWTVAFISLAVFVGLRSQTGFGHNSGRMRLFALPMAVIVLGIFLMLINFNLTILKNKLPVEVSPTYGTSLSIAEKSLASRPLGYGLENFQIAYDKFKPANIANTLFFQVRFNNSASAIVDLAIEGGILMLLAFLSLFWFYGKEFVAKIKNADNQMNSVWAAGLGSLVALFFYPLNITLMTVLVLLLAPVSLSSWRKSAVADTDQDEQLANDYGASHISENSDERIVDLESSAKYSFLGSLGFIIGLVLVLVAGYFTVNNYISNVYLAQALATSDKNKAIASFVKSSNSNNSDTRVYRFLSQIIIAQLGEDLKNGPKKDEIKENYNARIQNQIASAANVAVRATTMSPSDSLNWANLAMVYQNLIGLVGGADQAAVAAYSESLKRNSADPVTYLRIGTTYLSVAENLQGLINNPPANQSGKLDLEAIKKQIADDLSKAEDNFKKSIALYNNFGPALYNLAVVYDREGKLPEAIKQFEKLQASNPNDPSVVFQLGLLYYRNNQKDNAFQAWQRAVVLFPNYSNARWYLSLVYEERGDLANALTQVEAIQKLNPDDQMVQQRLEQLRAGKRTIPPQKVLDKQPLNK